MAGLGETQTPRRPPAADHQAKNRTLGGLLNEIGAGGASGKRRPPALSRDIMAAAAALEPGYESDEVEEISLQEPEPPRNGLHEPVDHDLGYDGMEVDNHQPTRRSRLIIDESEPEPEGEEDDAMKICKCC